MRLSKITISGYRSISGSESMIIGERTTVLIGANDHGKTNILNAIRSLNDENPLTEEDLNWDAENAGNVGIEWEFIFNSEDEKLEMRRKLMASPEAAPIPEEEMVTLPTNASNSIVYSRFGTGNSVVVKSVPFHVPKEVESLIVSERPRIELFEPPTTNLEDSVSQAELETNLVMQGIFRLAGIWDDRSEIFTRNAKTSKKLDDASTHLTEVLRDQWNQGKDLEWKLKHNGDRIEIEIRDPSIENRYSRPSLRSSGFRTYFLLSMITSARTAAAPEKSHIFLFDEPGTYLHPHAQIDLQRSFESIAGHAQIIYTTHSLFLINKNHPARNRVVSKNSSGTHIDQKPFRKNWKSVRDSLGILFINNFLIADKTLLVEGPSDVIYILSAIKKFKENQGVDIDLNDLSIVDAGTSENYLAMCKLMLSEGRTVVAMMDGDTAGKELQRKLKIVCEQSLKDKTLALLELPPDTSIEDIFADLNILQKSIKEVSEDLVSQKIRRFSTEDFDIDEASKKIIPAPPDTLGYIIDKVTPDWFAPKEKLSKLSVSLKYEDISSGHELSLDARSKAWIEKIKKSLGLRGEASYETGVFEGVDE